MIKFVCIKVKVLFVNMVVANFYSDFLKVVNETYEYPLWINSHCPFMQK